MTSTNQDDEERTIEDPAMFSSISGDDSVKRKTDMKKNRISRINRVNRASTLDGDTMPASWKDRRMRLKSKNLERSGTVDGSNSNSNNNNHDNDDMADDDPFKTKGRPALSRCATR
jgi:hypothetical protein